MQCEGGLDESESWKVEETRSHYVSACLSVCLPVCLPACIWLSVCRSLVSFVSVTNIRGSYTPKHKHTDWLTKDKRNSATTIHKLLRAKQNKKTAKPNPGSCNTVNAHPGRVEKCKCHSDAIITKPLLCLCLCLFWLNTHRLQVGVRPVGFQVIWWWTYLS